MGDYMGLFFSVFGDVIEACDAIGNYADILRQSLCALSETLKYLGIRKVCYAIVTH